MKLPRKRQPGAALAGFRKDLTAFPQIVELPNVSLKTCQVLRNCIVTKEIVANDR
jgi:hypothetical protein